MWRFGLMFSIGFILAGVVMAVLGRIDYSYHYGSTQVVGVIRVEDSPFRFWITIATFIAVGIVGATFTWARYSRVRREENEKA
jgi:membrane protein implicated in regulation of membrane protease activity